MSQEQQYSGALIESLTRDVVAAEQSLPRVVEDPSHQGCTSSVPQSSVGMAVSQFPRVDVAEFNPAAKSVEYPLPTDQSSVIDRPAEVGADGHVGVSQVDAESVTGQAGGPRSIPSQPCVGEQADEIPRPSVFKVGDYFTDQRYEGLVIVGVVTDVSERAEGGQYVTGAELTYMGSRASINTHYVVRNTDLRKLEVVGG